MRKKWSDSHIQDLDDHATHATLWWRSQSSIVRMWVACVRTREAPVIRPPRKEKERQKGGQWLCTHTHAQRNIFLDHKLKRNKRNWSKNCALARGSSFSSFLFSLCRPRLDIVQRYASAISWSWPQRKRRKTLRTHFLSPRTGHWPPLRGNRMLVLDRKCKSEEKGTSSRCDLTR